jgi:hypothetical protein
MLRVQIRDASNTFLMTIKGRFSGEDAAFVQTLMARCHTSLDFVIDITDVTLVDSTGEAALTLFKRLGAVFVADNSSSLHVCERLQLSLSDKYRPRALGRSAPPCATMEGCIHLLAGRLATVRCGGLGDGKQNFGSRFVAMKGRLEG